MGVEQKLGNLGIGDHDVGAGSQLESHKRHVADAFGLACCAIE